MPLSKLLKSSPIPKVLFIGLLYQVQPVWAATCTTAPECEQGGTEGFIGGTLNGVSIRPGVPNPSSFDTTRFTSTTGYELWVTEDIRGVTTPNSPYAIVEKMFFDGDSANNAQRMDVTFFSSITEGGRLEKDTGEARSLETSQLNLNYVNFETKPSLKFFGTDNEINLIDSRVYFRASPQFISTAPLTINVNDLSGSGKESSFFNFSGNIFPTSTTINIENGNTLTFEDSGRVFASVNSERLNFGSEVFGIVDAGTLKIDNSNVYFNSTSFDFTNGSTLNTVGSDSSVEFKALLFDNSLMTLGNNTTVTATDLDLDSAFITLGSGAKINATILTVKNGNGFQTTLSGGRNNASINVEGVIIESGATFQLQDGTRVNGGSDLILRPDATLSINDDSVFIVKTIAGFSDPTQTRTVDINTGGIFFLENGFSGLGRNITFDVDGDSFLRVGSNGLLELGFESDSRFTFRTDLGEISVQNDGQIDIDGKVSGDGTIAGSGKFLINNSGQIAPGSVARFSTGTITFENAFEFTNFGTSGNRSRYLVDVDVLGGTPRNDLLQYDDQGFDITQLESIEVTTASGRTADELDGQFFTIISSVDAGSTGTLSTGGSYPIIVEGANTPALIDFTVFNNNTFGNDDVTLGANKNYDQLVKHPSVKPAHTLTTTATTTVAPGTGQAVTTISTLLPAQPDPTATTSTSTTTVEPSTGNTILTKVTVAPNPAGGDSHQQTVYTTVTTPTGIVIDQSKVATPLTPDAIDTAHQVTTTHVTSTQGSLVSTSTGATVQPAATGTANLSGAANLLVNSANAGNLQSQAALNNLTNNQVASHVESIHPEPYSSYMTISLEHSDMVINTVLNHTAPSSHVSTGRTSEAEEKHTGKHFWMDVGYAEGDVSGEGDLGDFDYNLSSLTIGQDLIASGDRTLGMYFSFGTQKMDEHDKAIQDFSGDVYHLGMYLNQADVGGWDLRGVLGYAYSDHSSKRQVNLSTSSTIASADFNGHSAYAGVKGTVTGYQNDWLTLSPELGLSYIYYTQESIQESGDPDLSLKIDSAEAHAIIASAGLNARFASFSETTSIYPLAFARYEHDFYANANNEHEIDAALVSNPDYKQTFVGQNRGEHAIITGVGLGSDINSVLQVNGGLVYTVSSHGREWGAGLNLEYSW